MDTLVPQEVLAELSQILSNLVLGENDIRRAAEKVLNEKWLANQPEAVLLALTQFSRQSPDNHMRSFAAVLLRRFLFRPVPSATRLHSAAIYDHLSEATRKTIESLMLVCLANEVVDSVRNKIVDTVTEIAEGSMARARPWPELQAFAAESTMSNDPRHRETAFRIFASVPQLILDQKTDEVVGVMERGLKDPQSIDVQLAALRAAVSFLTTADKETENEASPLMYAMLGALPPIPPTILTPFLQAINPLATAEPNLLRPHLPSLLAFLPPLILSHSAPEAPTPTAGNPASSGGESVTASREDLEGTRLAALELMITLTESLPKGVQTCPGWVEGVVRCCLEGLAEVQDDDDGEWAELDPSHETDFDEGYPRVYEESLDRIACALGGNAVLPVTFQYIPAMLNSSDWRQRHGGLMAICAIGEGTATVMEKELGTIVSLVTPTFSDPHPRVRHGACQCIGQLCTDMEDLIQREYSEPVMAALIPALHAPEPRVHAHAAAALINFCTGAPPEIITPHLDGVVAGLLSLLNSPKPYVQHQAFTTLAMVADAAQKSFRKYYGLIMPMVLTVLRSATEKGHRILRCRAMECGGLVAIAVGKEMFRPNAPEFTELLLRIQNAITDPDDPTIPYLSQTWAKVGQVLKADFEPFLAFVMPPLLRSASLKPEMSILGENEDAESSGEWQTVRLGGQRIGIRTGVLEEKAQAFNTIVCHCTNMGSKFAPYVHSVLEVCLPSLRYVYHDGVQESAAMLIPMLVASGKSILTPAAIHTIFTQLLESIAAETDVACLSSLYKSFNDTLLILGSDAIDPGVGDRIVKITQNQLSSMAERRKKRNEHVMRQQGANSEEDHEDVMLLEELEDFALEEIVRLLQMFDRNHPLLAAVGSVKDMGFSGERYGYEDAPTP